MPKPLRHPPPSSSIARLLDLDAAARAVAAPLSTEPPTVSVRPEAMASLPRQPALPDCGETPRTKRELVLTPSADETFSRLVELYRRSTETKLTSSHVARAILKGIAHCMDFLEREARRMKPLKLPSNARGRQLERERFEARIADAFVAGIRSAPAMEED